MALNDSGEEENGENGKDENGDNGEENENSEESEEKKDETFEPVNFRIEVEYERDIPQGTIVLRNARIITMNGDEVIERGDLLVENNRITAVGEAGSITVPQGAQVRDLSGKTIVPGFIDVHAHMWPTWGIHKRDIWMYSANLAYGVTTTRDPQTGTTDVLTYGDMVEAGKLADLIILDDNPLEDIRNTNSIRYVMKNGRMYDGDTLDELYPRQREANKQRWTDEPDRELPGIYRH